jgi:signal transduction histidine kinase
LLISRCLSKATTESVETTWRTKDRGRLVVRLLAVPAGSESIEIVVEDLTQLRALEDRLHQAQRMEAVGRLAAEVAGTCDNLLRDVSQDARQWLETIDRDSAFRHRGELLIEEVTRGAGFLRQLAVYGTKQASLEPTDVNRVLRDLESVLKRIAGDGIELVLPKTSSPVNVDVEVERVERILVNVAGYSRARMPLGGRLTIELATVVISREFVAKYPNVRPGDHVLITVTEMRGGSRSDVPIGSRSEAAESNTMRSESDRPGVDLGVLQGLIRDCGGHLWMRADPTGDLVLKMRLPQRVLDGPGHGRSIGRWFRH